MKSGKQLYDEYVKAQFVEPTATEADLNYLRNINTRPGPGVGQSIDPTKPGPTADRIAELERQLSDLKNVASAAYRRSEIRVELSRLRNEQPKGGDAHPMLGALDHIARLTKQRDALIHVLQRCRTVLNNMAMENEGALFNRWPIHHEPLRSDAKHLLPLIESTLDAVPEPEAQSDPQQELSEIAAAIGSTRFMDPPDGGDVSLAEQVRRMREALEKAEAQSDAQPVGWQQALDFFKDRWRTHRDAAAKSWDSRDENRAMADKYWSAYFLLKDYVEKLSTPPSLPEGAREALEKIERGITAVRLETALNEQPIAPDVLEQIHKDLLAIMKLTRARATNRSVT